MDIQISDMFSQGLFVYGDTDFEMGFEFGSIYSEVRTIDGVKHYELTIQFNELPEEEEDGDLETCDDCSAQQLDFNPGDSGPGSERTPGSSIEFFNR